MKARTYIGIDPGSTNGCIAVLAPKELPYYYKFRRLDAAGYYKMAEEIKELYCQGEYTVGIENQVFKNFVLVRHHGNLMYLMDLHKIKYKPLMARSWQKYYKVPTKMTYKARKEHLKGLAQSVFPSEKVTLETADSLLIANFLKET